MNIVSQVAISSAVAASLVSAAAGQPAISYEQILNDPTNIELNYAFARQRMEEGDLVSASATLERILFIEPNWDEARLLYAGLLYRLGDTGAAQRELDLLERRALSHDAKVQLEAYQAKVDRADAKTRYRARVSVGLGYDENAAFLITEDVGVAEQIDQFSFVGRLTGEIEHSISKTTDRELFARGDMFTKQFEDDVIDGYFVTTARAGLRENRSRFGYQINASLRNVNIQGSEFLTEIGAEASVSRKIDGKTAVGVLASFHDQEFNRLDGPADPSAGRTGERIDGALFVKHAFTPRVRGTARLDVREKTAETSDFNYTFWGGQVGAEFIRDSGSYVDVDFIYRDYTYDGAFDSAVGQREDQYFFGRLAYGLPLGSLAPAGSPGEDLPLSLETSVYSTNRTSNVELFDFDSVGVEARLIWRFGE